MSVLFSLSAAVLAATQQADPLAPVSQQVQPGLQILPAQPTAQVLTPAPVAPPPVIVAVPRDWRGVFDAIRSGQWAAASAGIAALPPGPLSAVAKAELFTARGSPAVPAEPLVALLAQAPELPGADQLLRLAQSRGATALPQIAGRYPQVQIGHSPRRVRARPVSGEVEADRLRAELEAYVKADDAAGAELLLQSRAPYLSPEARAEVSQRIAWMHYTRNDDANARRVAEIGRMSSIGEWAVQNAWVAGLAAWRQNDCNTASANFRTVGQRAGEQSLRAGGLYWAARAEMACRRPGAVTPLMRAAAAMNETFYGMLARRTLGMDARFAPLSDVSDPRVESLPNVQRAVELARIGERDLAGQYLRHQARLGRPQDQLGLIAVARRLDLPATQHILAHFGQPGTRVPAAARYPRPNWAPRGGWRIDPALGMAHALQESSFRAEAVSPAGAVGLMQVLPTTMTLISRNRGLAAGDLRDPATNMEFGQSWIEWMRGHGATQGHLPKIVASYNAGPLPVGRWAYLDRGDPLLWIESIPYWETRYYVPTVLRNMWVYEGFTGGQMPTLTQLAQHKWPALPVARR
ncbi:lytic transglycosylase domain-containing protein [uncultured Sphingomonas sp.]|uniref:lytic transglycosylase domain-containing protein n=1 Tax=uncultured Sphingomonas sp. TaxID=158754 RepID=UPI0025D51925|nr:lytic transglycosylase domain-containing protein [uncultured Sphingomonas sp.]